MTSILVHTTQTFQWKV